MFSDVCSGDTCFRQESEGEDQRIVWTYNAPLTDSSSSHASTSSNGSPHRSGSPASPTSVSSSVMSSSNSSDSDKGRLNVHPGVAAGGTGQAGDLSQSEAVSNISSPDFQEEDSEIIARDLVMEVSDPSDSDSTLLVSETNKSRRNNNHNNNNGAISAKDGDHRIVIQARHLSLIYIYIYINL